MKKRIFALVLALLMIIPLIAAFTARAEGAGLAVGYSSPAICVDAGEKVDLAEVSVQFEHGADPISGITWKDGGNTVTSFTPAAKGVYELTATANGKTKKIYVVAKNANESEYVLYENDFSTAPDLTQFRAVHQPSGTTFGYDEAEGAIYLESTKNTSDMIRVLLPEYLDSFGDAIYSADMKITKALNNSRWCSLVIRQQNPTTTKLPYLQVVSRYVNNSSNGLEIAERTAADKWNVIEKGACTGGVQAGEYFTITSTACGQVVTNSINGKVYLTEKSAPYTSGAMGLQANGSRMTVSRIKITVNPESKVTDRTGGLHETRQAESNIVLAPALVTEVKTASELKALATALPAVAIFDAQMNGTELGVTLDGKFTKLADADAGKNIIPAYRVDGREEAEALGSYAKSLPVCDMYVISSDMSLIGAARKLCDRLYGMVEMSALPEDCEKLRSEIISCGARGVIVTEKSAKRDEVSYLQDRYIVVWQKTDGKDLSSVTAINNGVLGIVTPDVKATEACYTKYYKENTLIRTPEIIGHRGIPSKAQENTLAGAILALKEGATMVECDVYLLKDGKIVVMHDGTIDRTTDGTGNTADQTASSLSGVKVDSLAGVDPEPVPMLEDLLKAFKESGDVLVIELKSSDTALCKPVVDLIKKYEMEKQTVIIAFGQAMIKAIRNADPGISVNFLTSNITADEDLSLAVSAQVLDIVTRLNTAYSPNKNSGTLGPKLYSDLAARGVTVWNWTVNDQAEFNKYFVSGIRGITTNYADWAGTYVNDFRIELGEDGEIKPSAVNYKGGSVSASGAELVVIGGTGEYKDGRVTLSEGAEGFFFRLKKTLSDGTQYSVVTSVMTVSEMNTPADPDQTSDQTNADNTADATGTDEPADEGCGSIIAAPALAIVALGVAVIKKRRR